MGDSAAEQNGPRTEALRRALGQVHDEAGAGRSVILRVLANAAPSRHCRHPAREPDPSGQSGAGSRDSCRADATIAPCFVRHAGGTVRPQEARNGGQQGVSGREGRAGGLLRDGMTIVAAASACAASPSLIDAIRRQRRQGPDRRLATMPASTIRPRHAAADAADPEDDQLLRRREQGVRAPVPGRRARGRVQPAGHAGRADPRRRRRHPGLLHQDRRRHAGRRGQGDRASSTARPTSWSAASSPTSRSSRPGRATTRATSSIGRPRATSTR